MKILHTSDWHLGKRTEGKSRLPEQEQALENLVRAVAEYKADAVVAAGDIFDTVNPPAEAEALFYRFALTVSRLCPFIAVAGNHDNADRLRAPDGIARECGILLGGSLDFSAAKDPFSGGEGWVKLRKKGECVNFALLPYPSISRMSALGYEYDEKKDGDGKATKTYADHVREWLGLCARGFTASDCNITVSHLFMAGSTRASDETELGTAALLPADVLPEAHYTALGHIHKPQCVSKARNVYYSGSLLAYTFDDDSQKFFNLITTNGSAGVTVEKIPVGAGKPLLTLPVKSFDEAMRALKQNPAAYVRLLYDSSQPLSADRYAEMRAQDNFVSLKNIAMLPASVQERHKTVSDRELFTAYYRSRFGEETPSDELLNLFDKAMRGEEL